MTAVLTIAVIAKLPVAPVSGRTLSTGTRFLVRAQRVEDAGKGSEQWFAAEPWVDCVGEDGREGCTLEHLGAFIQQGLIPSGMSYEALVAQRATLKPWAQVALESAVLGWFESHRPHEWLAGQTGDPVCSRCGETGYRIPARDSGGIVGRLQTRHERGCWRGETYCLSHGTADYWFEGDQCPLCEIEREDETPHAPRRRRHRRGHRAGQPAMG